MWRFGSMDLSFGTAEMTALRFNRIYNLQFIDGEMAEWLKALVC